MTTSDILNIMRYKALNGTWYRIAYYDNDWRFVHITHNKLSTCTAHKSKTGKKYLQYIGTFEVCEDGTIDIY